MGVLEVCDEGLRALSGQCTGVASRLASQVPVPAVGPLTQATVGAVGSAYTALDETASVLAARVHTTGRSLTISARRYVSNDEASAQQLDALGGGSVRG